LKKYLYIFQSSTHDSDVLTFLTHPRTILLVVLEIGKEETGKAKDFSAPLRIAQNTLAVSRHVEENIAAQLIGTGT
jgi:hypothetical protein